MLPYVRNYVLLHVGLSLAASLLLLRNWRAYPFVRRDYWRFVLRPWKIAGFVVGMLVIVLPTPYLNLRSWDYVTAVLAPLLAYPTAPWVIGTVWQYLRRRHDEASHLFTATILGLFAAAWSTDLYLWARDGEYPPDWRANLIIGAAFYTLAGLFFNLDWLPGRGIHMAFERDDWFMAHDHPVFRHVWWIGASIALIVCVFVASQWLRTRG